jgi:spore germination protein GerM
MGKKFISSLAIIVIVCLLGGGCGDITEKQSIKTWRDLLNPMPGQTGTQAKLEEEDKYEQTEKIAEIGETIEVKLFFYDPNTKSLVEEKKKIPKAESIARSTVEHLLAGPLNKDYLTVFPSGTKLLDINIKKEEELCIVDLSPEVKNIADLQQARQIVESIAHTLGQFSTIKKVKILIAGQDIENVPEFSAIAPQLILLSIKNADKYLSAAKENSMY